MKDDPIFVEFPKYFELIALDEVIANRDRPDISTEDESAYNALRAAEPQERESSWNVMDNLEQALSTGTLQDAPEPDNHDVDARVTEDRKLSIPKDESQEDILARLGVTGSPKPIQPSSKIGRRDSNVNGQ